MTNSQIIYQSAQAHGFTAEQLDQLLNAYNGVLPFHTFQEWQARGFSVKRGERALFTADLWKYTDKPGKAAREAAEEQGEEAAASGHYYKKLSHLFSFSQVERQTPAPDLQTILDRFQNVPGLTVKVNGAQTAAPVVWLSGDTDAHADTIKATGGHWSAKKSAWFFKPTHKTADDKKPADEIPAEPQQAAPAAEPKTAAALDPFGPRFSFKRCPVYAIRRDSEQKAPCVHELDGYTDGVYSYYSETCDGKHKTWFAIVPAYGLSVAQGSTRKEVQDKTHEMAARIASSLSHANDDERMKQYAAMIAAHQQDADQEIIPQF